jgi:hypothetical protein
LKEPDNFIIMWDASTNFQECGTLEQALDDVKKMIDDIIIYSCTEIPVHIALKAQVTEIVEE